MKTKFLILTLFLSQPAFTAPAQLRYSQEFILSEVLLIMGHKQKPNVPAPEVRFASLTTIQEFQNDIGVQWGSPPDRITNAFAAEVNRIYILDEAEYYIRTKRCMDDSLAHEYAHFVQVYYKGFPIDQFDDSMESEAVDVQTQFREKHCPL